MFSTQNHIQVQRDYVYPSFLSGGLDNPSTHLRARYLNFLNQLANDPSLAQQLGLSASHRDPTPTIQLIRRLSKKHDKAREILQQHYSAPKLKCKTSIEDRIMVQEDQDEIFDLSSGLLCSGEVSEPALEELLVSSPLSLEVMTELLGDKEMEIGLTSIVLLCKYALSDRNNIGKSTIKRLFVTSTIVAFKLSYELVSPELTELLGDKEMEIGLTSIVLLCKYALSDRNNIGKSTIKRLFVTSTIVAFKLSYELVSPEFVKFVAQLIGVDIEVVHALERHFVRTLNYDLHVNSTHIKKLIKLIVM